MGLNVTKEVLRHDTHLRNSVNFMDACGHIGIFSYLLVFQNILFIILYK